MKTKLFATIALLILVRLVVYPIMGGKSTFKTEVKQEVRNIAGPTLVTDVFYQGDNVETYFDSLDSVLYTDSTAYKRRKEGEWLIRKINRTLNKRINYK